MKINGNEMSIKEIKLLDEIQKQTFDIWSIMLTLTQTKNMSHTQII
jgi:hypothetical protein